MGIPLSAESGRGGRVSAGTRPQRTQVLLRHFRHGAATTLLTVLAIAVFAQHLPAAVLETNVYEQSGKVVADTPLDRLVFAKLDELGLEPRLCSDSTFVRRAFLDVIGTLPMAREARDFIKSSDKNKRRRLIDHLLERKEFADYWAMKWGDILRIKAEFPVNLWPNAAQAYHRWVRASIAANKPYDQFARELLVSSGSNFRVGPVNFYRAVQTRTPEGIAGAVALTFMGTRPESLSKEQLTGLVPFFSQIGYKATREWKEENVFWDPLNSAALATNQTGSALPAETPPQSAMFPDGKTIRLPSGQDPRQIFADWLIRPDNRWFTRNIANRVWAWLLGRGVIHEPDDIRPDNPPSDPALLAYLEKEMVASRYDLKRFYRLILNSKTYQLSAVRREKPEEAEKHFGVYPLRRLEAEVLIDSINKITGTTDLYTSAIPEPFTYIPADLPAIAIADGSITSPFLTLFGRSARATGMENERENKVVPAQWLHLLNSSHIQRKLEQGPALKTLLDPKAKPAQVIEELYLTILSRLPTDQELKVLMDYGKPGKNGRIKTREDWIDIAWALINNPEFIYRH